MAKIQNPKNVWNCRQWVRIEKKRNGRGIGWRLMEVTGLVEHTRFTRYFVRVSRQRRTNPDFWWSYVRRVLEKQHTGLLFLCRGSARAGRFDFVREVQTVRAEESAEISLSPRSCASFNPHHKHQLHISVSGLEPPGQQSRRGRHIKTAYVTAYTVKPHGQENRSHVQALLSIKRNRCISKLKY